MAVSIIAGITAVSFVIFCLTLVADHHVKKERAKIKPKRFDYTNS